MLYGVSEKTTVSTLLSAFSTKNLTVYDGDGNAVSGSTIVGTGYCIRIVENGKVVDYLEIIVKGDVDGNGILSATDYLRIKHYFLGNITLTEPQIKAADIDSNERIESADYLLIKSHFLKLTDIYGGK